MVCVNILHNYALNCSSHRRIPYHSKCYWAPNQGWRVVCSAIASYHCQSPPYTSSVMSWCSLIIEAYTLWKQFTNILRPPQQ